MEYKFIPDTFDYEIIKHKFGSFDRFTTSQILYKQRFEKILASLLDIDKLQALADVEIPVIEDSNANFYRKFSMFNDPYIYVRNNYNVERLTTEEISVLENSTEISRDFLMRTFEKVMYEEGDFTFYGTPRRETECPSKSIVFEFAYDQVKCTSIEQLMIIEVIIEKRETMISDKMQNINIPCSFVVYKGIPKIYPLDNTAGAIK